jgi:hypothetical protein
VVKAGTISFGGATIPCVVRNLSTVGALLIVESPLGIPRRFTLLVRLGLVCEGVSRDLDHGVSF